MDCCDDTACHASRHFHNHTVNLKGHSLLYSSAKSDPMFFLFANTTTKMARAQHQRELEEQRTKLVKLSADLEERDRLLLVEKVRKDAEAETMRELSTVRYPLIRGKAAGGERVRVRGQDGSLKRRRAMRRRQRRRRSECNGSL